MYRSYTPYPVFQPSASAHHAAATELYNEKIHLNGRVFALLSSNFAKVSPTSSSLLYNFLSQIIVPTQSVLITIYSP
jgi:hypothetical protein